MNKKVMCVGVSSDMTSLTHIFVRPGESSKLITGEASEILENLQSVLLTNHARKSIDGTLGRWLTLRKPAGAFFSLVSPSYPERIGFKSLDELNDAYEIFLQSHDLDQLKSASA